MFETEKKLSVILPAYNEGVHIYENLHIVSQVLSGFIKDYEIVAVNDGSTDHTREEILRYAKVDVHVRPVSYKKNHGKGNAIKCGVKQASGDYIAFLDSDLDLPAEQIKDYLIPLLHDETDVVIASKMHKDSKIEYPAIRRVISFCYYCMLRLLFHLKVKDTQTGLKVFKAGALKSVIGSIHTKGFAYDIEILVALNAKGYRIMEMPVELVFRRGHGMGRIGLKDIVTVFRDTLRIFYFRRIKKVY